MAEVSYLASFLGGALSLLSPCSALLLPAFFAYAFGGSGELVKKTGVFYLGLSATLVPLGMGISAVSAIFYGQRSLLILVSGFLLIFFGVLQILGRGFAVGPLQRLQGRIKGDSAAAVFALGAVYGFVGFCSGPILGAVLTVAAASGGVLQGAALLAVYALGMALPLFAMALLWQRLDLGKSRWLRGREIGLAGIRLHTTSLLSGLMFVALGVVFIAYEGGSALSGLYESNGATDLAFAAERWIDEATAGATGIVLTVLLVAVAVVALARGLLKRRPEAPTTDLKDERRHEGERS